MLGFVGNATDFEYGFVKIVTGMGRNNKNPVAPPPSKVLLLRFVLKNGGRVLELLDFLIPFDEEIFIEALVRQA